MKRLQRYKTTPKARKPREWQEKALEFFKRSTKPNIVIEACVSSGKTTAAEMLAHHSLSTGESDFVVILVTNEHLLSSFCEEAKENGLELIAANDSKVRIFNSPEATGLPGPNAPAGSYPTLQNMKDKGFDGIVMAIQSLTNETKQQILKRQLGLLGKTMLIIDEIHHYGDALEKKEDDETPGFTKAAYNVFDDQIVSRRLLCTGTPFRSDPRRILGDWIDYVTNEEGKEEMAVSYLRHQLTDICEEEVAYVNEHGLRVLYTQHGLGRYAFCPPCLFELPEFKHSWTDEACDLEGKTSKPPRVETDITWTYANGQTDEKGYFLSRCKSNAVKAENDFFPFIIKKIDSEITEARQLKDLPRPESACLVVAPCRNDEKGPEDKASKIIIDKYCDVIKRETGSDAWVIVGNIELCRAGKIKKVLGQSINNVEIGKPSDLIKAFNVDIGVHSSRYVITQKMIAEGATIKRLDHVFFCGTDLTEMFLWQVLGRILRLLFPSDTKNKIAKFWGYKHPVIQSWATAITSEMKAIKKEEGEPGGEGPPPKEHLWVNHHNNSFSYDFNIQNGKIFEGKKLDLIKYWLRTSRSRLSIAEAEKVISEQGLWEWLNSAFQENQEQEPEPSKDETCYIHQVIPDRLGDWRTFDLSTQIKIVQEVLRKIMQNYYWRQSFGEVKHETIGKEDKERLFKKASYYYRQTLIQLESEAKSMKVPYLERVYDAGEEWKNKLKEDYNFDHVQITNYNFPKNV